MKNSILILAVLFFISSCNNDADGLITEKAIVYPCLGLGFNNYCCKYTIKTQIRNKIFLANNENEYDFYKFFPNDPNGIDIKMTYRIIREIKPGNYDKNCYLRNAKELIVIIEIISAEIIQQNI